MESETAGVRATGGVVVARASRLRYVAVAVLLAGAASWLRQLIGAVTGTPSWSATFAGVVFTVGFAVLAWRTAWPRVRCDAAGLVVYLAATTRHYLWSDIERFEVRGWWGVGLRLTGGQWERVVFTAPWGSRSSDAVVAVLEATRRRYQDAG